MCHYVDTVFVYSCCTAKHRVTNRAYSICANPNPRGLERQCQNATPDPNVALGSTKRNQECPVCKGERPEMVSVSLSEHVVQRHEPNCPRLTSKTNSLERWLQLHQVGAILLE